MRKTWWKEGIIYQIYPQSFNDSNGDGIGDLRGIIEKLDYVKSLGVDIIWLNPVYDSPLDDNGYDIRDYRKIHERYGTMEDFEELLDEVHKRDMRLLMDLVVNHSSDEHKWFAESRKSKDNPYRDYYFWRQGKNGGPPNDWISVFGGSVWEYDEATDEYYLHYFTKKQPDLNWENPKVRKEVIDLVTWWLEKGIDGFRLDVISMISKYLDFPDANPSDVQGAEGKTVGHVKPGEMITKYFCNGPRVHEFIRELSENTFEKYDVTTVGEGPGISKELGVLYTGENRHELHMIFPLDLMFADWGPGGKYDSQGTQVAHIKAFFRDWAEALTDDGWMSVFLDNHDFARMVSRYGNDHEYREECAKCLATLLLTLRGTPSIHYGSEIGMTNVAFDAIGEYRDVESLNFYREAIESGMAPEEALRRLQLYGRDNVRTPMQWDASVNGGFSTAQPWLKVNPNYTEINVAKEEAKQNGILAYYRKMIAFRKENDCLVYGSFNDLDPAHRSVFIYERADSKEVFTVVLNMADETVEYPRAKDAGELVMYNYGYADNAVELKPWEARVYVRPATQ